MKSKFLILLLSLFVVGPIWAQDATYSILTYNVENLFDNDGIAAFNDYKKVDRDGNPLYSAMDVYNKAHNIARVLSAHNEGQGPNIAVFNELESDHSSPDSRLVPDLSTWYKETQGQPLKSLLQAEVELSSVQILWLALKELGMEYEYVAVGVPPMVLGKPQTTQMNVVMSKIPFLVEEVQIHKLERARPILEVPFQLENHTFYVFANHWKSGASSPEQEEVRVQNASVLKARVDELLKQKPEADIVLTGDFNVNYDQHVVMRGKVDRVSLDVLGVNGIEASKNFFFNLWHELPISERGSDTYRGEWGTLMQSMINANWYDSKGVQYVDQSYRVLAIPGLNQFAHSREPKRWSSFGDGYGFSDHFPIYFRFKLANGDFKPVVALNEENIFEWNDSRRDKVTYTRPSSVSEFPFENPMNATLQEYYYLDASLISEDMRSYDNGQFGLYIPERSVRNKIKSMKKAGKLNTVIGRFDTYRGNLQFVIEADYALINE